MSQFTSEYWYDEHKTRWDALVQAGFVFIVPDLVPTLAGITMSRDKDFRTFYTKKSDDFKTIHTKLLESCEAYANDAHHPERGTLPYHPSDRL